MLELCVFILDIFKDLFHRRTNCSEGGQTSASFLNLVDLSRISKHSKQHSEPLVGHRWRSDILQNST